MLELIPSLMVIVLFIFLGLLFYLNKTLYQPLLNFMNQRDMTIAKDFEEVNKLTTDSESLENEANELLEKAKQEAFEIRQKAIEEANVEANKLIEAKKEELEIKQQEFMDKLEKEKEELKAGILSQMPLIKETLKAKFSNL